MHHKTYQPAPRYVDVQASQIRTALGAVAYRAYSYTFTTSGPQASHTFYVVEAQFADKSVFTSSSDVGFNDALMRAWEQAAQIEEVF
jgi:hypothetical protein